MEDIEHYGIAVYNFPYDVEEDDEETIADNSELRGMMPFAIVGSEEEIVVGGQSVRARSYPWGYVEVDNPKHSDFSRLRSALLSTHLTDLKEITHDFLYENYRTEKVSLKVWRSPYDAVDSRSDTSSLLASAHSSRGLSTRTTPTHRFPATSLPTSRSSSRRTSCAARRRSSGKSSSRSSGRSRRRGRSSSQRRSRSATSRAGWLPRAARPDSAACVARCALECGDSARRSARPEGMGWECILTSRTMALSRCSPPCRAKGFPRPTGTFLACPRWTQRTPCSFTVDLGFSFRLLLRFPSLRSVVRFPRSPALKIYV